MRKLLSTSVVFGRAVASRMRKLVVATALAATTTAVAGTASANIIYTLNGVGMNSLTTGLGVPAGALTGNFVVDNTRTILVSADITASMATVPPNTFPGFEYIFGIRARTRR